MMPCQTMKNLERKQTDRDFSKEKQKKKVVVKNILRDFIVIN